MIVDLKFLEEVAKRKNILLYQLMSKEKDITNAVEIFKKHNAKFELMHMFFNLSNET